jgi:hypothetical protein
VVSKRWAIAIDAAMAALRATVLGDCGGGSSNEDGYCVSRGKYDSDSGNGIGDDWPCCPIHAHFITRHVVANAIARVIAIAIAFVSVRQTARAMAMATARAMATKRAMEGDNGKSDGDSNKEGEGKGSKRDGD